MKKKTCRSVITVVLVLALMLSLTAFASAAQPRYANIRNLRVDLSSASNGYTIDYAKVELYDRSYTAELTLDLMRNMNGTWTKVKSWSASGSPSAVIDEQWYVLAGYEYQLIATAKVYNPSGTCVETVTASSEVARC